MDIVVHKTIPDIKWPHRIVDNFFDDYDLAWVKESFELGYKDLQNRFPDYFVDGKLKQYEEIKHSYNEDLLLTGFSAYVAFFPTGRVSTPIDDIWRESVKLYPYKKNKSPERKDFFSYLELNIYPPGLKYGRHLDVSYKSFTGVIYIGETGQGTTLMSGDKTMQVQWKDNRSVLFMNCDDDRRLKRDETDELSSWHRYENKSDDFRYAVNFNMAHPQDMASMMSLFNHRDKTLFHPKKVSRTEKPTFGPILVNYKPIPIEEKRV